MLKNYTNIPRNEQRGRSEKRPQRPGFFILFILLIIGGILYYAFSRGILVLNTPNISSTLSTDKIKEVPPKEKQSKPRFEFYTLLSQEIVPVPHQKNATADVTTTTLPSEEEKAKLQKSEKSTLSKPLPAPSGLPSVPIYSTQNTTKSIPELQQTTETSSEKLAPIIEPNQVTLTQKQSNYVLQVAALPKLSDADTMKAQLSFLGFTVSIEPFQHNAATWYRVKVGPYSSLESAQKARQELSNHHLSSLLIRL